MSPHAKFPQKKLHANFVQVGYHPFMDDYEPRSILSNETLKSHIKIVRRNISEAFLAEHVPPFMKKYTQYESLIGMRSELLKLGWELWTTNDSERVLKHVLDNYIFKAGDCTMLMAPAFFIYAEIDKKIGIELIMYAKAIQMATDSLAGMPVEGIA